jgi:phosphoglycerate dehydrogenase-like enzyme
MPRPHRIEFLDNDHVLALARAVLAGPTAESVATVTGFFASEPVDVREVFALAPVRSALSLGDLPPRYGEMRVPSADTEVLVMRRGVITGELIDRLPRLQLIVRLGARPPSMDHEAATSGIRIASVPRRSLEWTAEHAILLMLALGKQLIVADRLTRAGKDGTDADSRAVGSDQDVTYNWPGLRGLWGLSGRTLAPIGMGEVGTLVASRAEALGMRVLPWSRSMGTLQDRDNILRSADVVSLHVPGTPANHHLVDSGFLGAMRPGAVLVNTSRGSLLDEQAVYAALIGGRLAGLGLDVHAHEPRPAADPLSTLDNVILTPHIAAGARTGVLSEIAAVVEHIRLFVGERE